MSDASVERTEQYAEALLTIARAEGHLAQVGDELYAVGQALDGSEELRNKLNDPHLPASTRQQIVEDLLAGKASAVTVALVSLVVGTGRAHDLPGIITELVKRSAAAHGHTVAEVRSAVELTDDQRTRLAAALEQAYGKVDIKVTVDPSVMGGIITQIGDTVIDGSVRHRLSQLREAI